MEKRWEAKITLDAPISNLLRQRNDDLTATLLESVWGLCSLNRASDANFYVQHYMSCLTAVNPAHFAPDTHGQVVNLTSFMKRSPDRSLVDLCDEILHKPAMWPGLKERTTEAVGAMLRFGAALWLLVDAEQWESGMSLELFVGTKFGKLKTADTKYPTAIVGDIPTVEFNARSLYRVGGLQLVWTSRLEDHLRLDGRSSQLYVFRHASFLCERLDSADSAIYPPGLLRETAETLAILFPLTDAPRRRWDRRIRQRADIDVETGLSCNTPREFSHYVYWHDRLQKLQDTFNRTKPQKLRQWVYDHRDRNQQATFWLAVLAISLTLLFGLIQSVTGILQVTLSS